VSRVTGRLLTWLRANLRLALVVLFVGVIIGVAMWPESIAVDIARVERGPMRVTIDEDGETRVRERFVVSAPVAGRLERIELDPGDRVVRGKTLVARLVPAPSTLLDPRTRSELAAAAGAAQASVGEARADRARATAALERARSARARLQVLANAGAVATDELEAAETAYRAAEEAHRAAEFAVTRAESELQLARARLAPPSAGGRPVEVLAPVDGVILRRLRESESVVPVGEPLVEIGDPDRLEVVADLLSTDAVRVSPGSPVSIEQWGGGRPLDARVRRVEPGGFMKISALGVEEQRVNVIIDFVDPAAVAGVLGDAYRVEVRVVVWETDDAVKAPVGSLFRQGSGWATFVVDGGRARLRAVEIGQRNAEHAQVLSGLQDGQPIVLHPPDTLTDGALIVERPS
jgi:HlyD family secretion protein